MGAMRVWVCLKAGKEKISMECYFRNLLFLLPLGCHFPHFSGKCFSIFLCLVVKMFTQEKNSLKARKMTSLMRVGKTSIRHDIPSLLSLLYPPNMRNSHCLDTSEPPFPIPSHSQWFVRLNINTLGIILFCYLPDTK